MANVILTIRVTLKGRLIKEHRFPQERITIGRDPESNVFLDNPGISRLHAVLERRGDTVMLQDMESANGTLLNDHSVRRESVKDGDKVRIGKFLLSLSIAEDRRGTSEEEERPRIGAHEGTMVMDTATIQRMLDQTKQGEERAGDRFLREREPVGQGAIVQGNVVRMPQPAAIPGRDFPPAATRSPRPLTASWWKAQATGLVIGFVLGVVVGVLLVGFLAG